MSHGINRRVVVDHSQSTSASDKDCATCKRRRIKCDRSPTACQKCEKRGLLCPGYGPRVQWVNDVATRGHLKGLQAAFLRGESRPAIQRVTPGSQRIHLVETQEHHKDAGSPSSNGQDSASDSPLDVPLDSLEKLKNYYRDHVARLMVWIDSEHNPYGTEVLSLVSTSHVLRLAISAISTLHWNATRPAEQLPLPEDIRDEAVLRITASVRAITDSTTLLDLEMAQWMLASMMVLSCCEMIKLGAMAADWHRRGARALVNVVTTMPWRDDKLLAFLMNQLAAYDILSCTTSLNLVDVQAAILPVQQGSGSMFSRILLLVHETTLHSRRNLSCFEEQRQSPQKTLSHLKYEIEVARGETLMAAGAADFPSEAQRRDFIRLVDLHCKAILIYARQTYQNSTTGLDTSLVDEFFCMLQAMEQPWQSCQNFAWPLFIAGTEVRESREKQKQVVTIFREIYSVTGFDHYRELIEFLESFWSGSSSHWLSLAKEWEMQGKRILAV